jgi:hypothetical protein
MTPTGGYHETLTLFWICAVTTSDRLRKVDPRACEWNAALVWEQESAVRVLHSGAADVVAGAHGWVSPT